MNEIPLINGHAYEWASITCVILGLPIAGIVEIDYSDSQDMENNYGAGRQPVSRSYGKIEYAGSVTLHAEEVVAIQRAITTGRLQDIPEFDIVVAYRSGVQVTTDVLKMCRFKNNARNTKEGDKTIPVKLDLVVGSIKWNG